MINALLPPALQNRLARYAETQELAATRKKKARQLKRESIAYWKKIKEVLIRMGYRHELPERKKPGILAALITGKRGFQVVRTDAINLRDDTISYHVDPMKMPWNTSVGGLFQPEIARELCIACQRRVTIEQDPDNYRTFIVVYRDDSIAGIPRMFRFREAYRSLPRKSHPLTFNIGIGEGRTVYQDDLHHIMSLMIAGSIGSGKSIFLNNVILTLAMRNPPSRLHLWLCDFKGGIELTFYKKLPHVREFLKEVEEVAPRIIELHDELVRRQGLFLDEDVNIDEYNRRQPDHVNKLPYIVMIIDEFAELALGLSGKERAHTMKLLMRLFQKGRACGIYFILATQSPTKEIMDKLIKHNIPSRMAFNCSTVHQSISVIGNAMATQLAPRGRAVWANDGVNTYVQAPFITKREKMFLIKKIATKWADEGEALQLNYEDILRYAIEHMDGKLGRDQLFAAFKTKLSARRLNLWLQKIEGNLVTVDGADYWVFKSTNPREPRRLQPATTISGVEAAPLPSPLFPHELAGHRISDAFLKGNGDIQHG